MATIGATTLGEILPSSMGPTTLDAVADIVAPKTKRAMPKKSVAKKPVAKKPAAKKATKPVAKKPVAKTNTGRKNSDGLVIWKGPRGGLFVMKNGKKMAVKK